MMTASRSEPLSPASCSSPMAKLDLRDLNVLDQLNLDTSELRDVLDRLSEAMESLKPSNQHPQRGPSREFALTSPDGTVRVAQTHLQRLPTKQESGHSFALVLDNQQAFGAHYEFRGSSPAIEHYISPYFEYVDEENKSNCKLGEITCPASSVLDAALDAIRDLLRHAQKAACDGRLRLGLVVAHNLIHPSLSSAYLLLPEDAVDAVPDPLAGTDLVNLINIGLLRHGIDAEIIGCVSNTSALLLTGALETPWDQPRCLVAVDVGVDFSAVFLQQELLATGSKGESVLFCDVGKFHGNQISSKETNFTTLYGIPVTIGDIQIGSQTVQSGGFCLDKLISARYLPEVCRTLLLRDLEHDAPAALWQPYALSFKACLEIRQSPQNAVGVFFRSIQWKPSDQEASRICEIVRLVFSRSAAMAAVVIADIAKRTGRLQPALGGLTIAFSGALVEETYIDDVRSALNKIFHRNTAGLINFMIPQSSFLAKGGAILSTMILTDE